MSEAECERCPTCGRPAATQEDEVAAAMDTLDAEWQARLDAAVAAERERCANLLHERADSFASHALYGSAYRSMSEDERSAAARNANQWFEAERQVRAVAAPVHAAAPKKEGT